MGTFAAQVSEWAQKEEQRLEAVFHTAAEMIAHEVTEPGPSVASTKSAIAKGLGSKGRGKNRKQVQGPVNRSGTGRLPVDTGNLRRSFMASSTAMPTIKAADTEFAEADISLVIGGAALGSTIFMGFQAEYAMRLEYGFVGTDSAGRLFNQSGYGFLHAAIQRWPQIVQAAEAKVRGRFHR